MNKDLTAGNPQKLLWAFCLPLFGSVIFQQLYNIADSLVAGKIIGESALAAVGNSYEITLVFIAFAFGCNIGCSVIVSQFFGARRLSEMKTAVYTSFISAAFILLVLVTGGLLLSDWALDLINTPSDIMADSLLYLKIYIWGLPFLFFYNISTGIFSALGDSKTPFIFLACSSTANILVDIYFVYKLQMGVAGVAWATFICQGISALLAFVTVIRRLNTVKCEEETKLFSFAILMKILKISLPSTAQQSFISIGNIIIQAVINGYGSAVIAGYAAAIKLNNLVITSFTTTANGISNYTAQNFGARKPERIREGFAAGIRIIWTIAVPFVLLYLLLPKYLVTFFMSEPSAEALGTGIIFLRIVAPFYLFVAVKLVCDGVLRGLGDMKKFMIDTFTDLILRVVLAIVFSNILHSSTGIWLAWPIGWLVATALAYWFYRLVSKEQLAEL